MTTNFRRGPWCAIAASMAIGIVLLGSASAAGAATNATTTVLSFSPSAPIIGQPVTYTATVSDSKPAVPTGTVTFSDGTNTICAPVSLNAAATATCSVTYFASGSKTVIASYSGDTKFSGSQFTLIHFVDDPPPAPTTLTAAQATRGFLSVTFSATLRRSSDSAPLSGKPISFQIHGHSVCSDDTNSSGKATCTVGSLFLGSGTYSAVFAGDSAYLGSTATAKY